MAEKRSSVVQAMCLNRLTPHLGVCPYDVEDSPTSRKVRYNKKDETTDKPKFAVKLFYPDEERNPGKADDARSNDEEWLNFGPQGA
jgi:hypothetical protein